MAKVKFLYEETEILAEVPDYLYVISNLLDETAENEAMMFQSLDDEDSAWEKAFDFVSDELKKVFNKITGIPVDTIMLDFLQLLDVDMIDGVDIKIKLEKYENENNQTF